MLKVLSELCKTHYLASFYTDVANTEKFIFGRVIALNEDTVVFQTLLPNGKDDGIVLMPVDRVFRVEENGQYAMAMHRLICKEDSHEYSLQIINNDTKNAVMSFALKNKHIVSIELLDSGYDNVVGFVDTTEDGQCKIRLVDDYGYADGFSYFLMADITQISILSESEKRIERLWKANGVITD